MLICSIFNFCLSFFQKNFRETSVLSNLIWALRNPFMCPWTSFSFSYSGYTKLSTVLSSLYLTLLRNTQEMTLFQISDRKSKVEFLQLCCLNAKLLISASSASLSLYSRVQFRSTPVQSENLLLHSGFYSIVVHETLPHQLVHVSLCFNPNFSPNSL